MPHRTPAPFERPRLAAARILLHYRPCSRIGLSLVPKSHPFHPFAASTLEDLDEFTTTALRPRDKNSIPATKLPRRLTRRTLALSTTGYLALAQFVPLMPAVVFYHGPLKVYPVSSIGLVEDKIVAPRLRVYMTPKTPNAFEK